MYINILLLKNYIICKNYDKIYKEKIKCEKNYNIFMNYINFKGYYLKFILVMSLKIQRSALMFWFIFSVSFWMAIDFLCVLCVQEMFISI